MLGRKIAVQCGGMFIIALTTINTGIVFGSETTEFADRNIITVRNDSLLADKKTKSSSAKVADDKSSSVKSTDAKKGAKDDKKKSASAKSKDENIKETSAKTSDNKTISEAETVAGENGVTITTSENSLDGLADDEIFVEKTTVQREFVLEEEFKLWRTVVQKGRKTIVYRKVEVPYGVYYKKNQMDITEEYYLHETKDLPEGETKRLKREDFEAQERERINKEIMDHFQIRVIPMDSTYFAPADTTSGNR